MSVDSKLAGMEGGDNFCQQTTTASAAGYNMTWMLTFTSIKKEERASPSNNVRQTSTPFVSLVADYLIAVRLLVF